jgi:lipopolysaccharide export system protein LptA
MLTLALMPLTPRSAYSASTTLPVQPQVVLPPLPASDAMPSPTSSLTEDLIALRDMGQATVTKGVQQGQMQVQAADPATGQTVNIDINSDELTYDPETELYTVSGNVYIIIPEKSTEILANKVTFNTKTNDMIAVGNVYIINNERVVGSSKASYDLKNNISYYNDPKTITDFFRIKAQQGQRTEFYTILQNGRIIVKADALTKFGSRYTKRGLRLGQGAIYSYYSAQRSGQLLQGELGNLNSDSGTDSTYSLDDTVFSPSDLNGTEQDKIADKPISPQDIANSDFSGQDGRYRIKIKKINIYRKADGFDTIVFKNTTFKINDFPIALLPSTEFGYDEKNRFLTYLGTEMGYNVDYGGAYLGPGWDFRFLNGWVRWSPIVSYGGGRRLRAHTDEPTQVPAQVGYGFLGHFRSNSNQTDFGYSSTLREPIFLSEQKLFGSNQTRLRLGANQYYNNGFFGIERPRLIGEVNNMSQFHPLDNWLLRTFVTAGVAKDDFFPTRDRRFFVKPKSADPITTARLQLQGQLRTTKPLLYLGKYAALGALAQGRLSLYGTGDAYGIIQGGPYMNMIAGPIFSQLRYTYSQVTGKSPFVFDSYYRGRNNLQTINSVDIGKFLTIGALNGLSLNRDNARNDLLVDQKLFISIGPKNVKFSMSYDTIQKRSFFGITINPHDGDVKADFDSLNIYEPDYESHLTPAMREAMKKKPPIPEAEPETQGNANTEPLLEVQ